MQGKKLNKTCFLRMMTAWMLAVALAVPSVLAAETGQPPPAADAPALLAATAPSAAIISPQADSLKHPTITITQTLVQDDFGAYTGVVELALTVKTEVGEPFRSVGLNLVYDPYLIPCDWTGQGTAVTLGANQYATNLPALKSDAITAGMAMAGGTKGYLYLGAMADLATDLDGKAPLALVRFKYADKDALKLGPGGKIQYAKAIGGHAVGADANLISFVSETDPDCYRGSQAPQQLWYESGDKSYYYNNSTVPPVGTQIPGETPGITAPCPVTHGKVVYSKAGAVYSFETNRLPTAAAPADKGVYMAEAEGPTQNKSGGGVSLSDIVTVVFFDWDDSFLGATAVPRGRDARKIVDDFVRANMVHPDLRTATEAQLKTKERQYTYRGEYPCEGPGVGATFPDGGANPGSKYALTNKLDYAFYGRSKDPAYPYVNGWQAVTPQTMANTWTALETGYTPPTTVNFQNITESTVYAKAIYEPGPTLNQGTGYGHYSIAGMPKFGIYGSPTATLGNYFIRFKYSRINEAGNGVTRAREPAMQMAMTPDVTGGTVFYLESYVANSDTLEVELTPAKGIATVNYFLTDTYGANIMDGKQLSEIGENDKLGVFQNYDPNFNPAMGKVGSNGFVKFCAMAFLVEHAYKNKNGISENKWSLVNNVILTDAGFKRLANGSSITTGMHANQAKTQILNCVGAAIAAGEPEVTYYQMQYQIIEKAYANAATAKAYCETNYEWCKP